MPLTVRDAGGVTRTIRTNDDMSGAAGTPNDNVLTVQGHAGGVSMPMDMKLAGKNMGGDYETVAALQTAQVVGPTGAVGDYISHILVIPATTAPGNVILLDGATSITVFVGGSASVATLTPFIIPLNMISVSGAWKITTGANVSCIAVGDFT